MERYVGERMGSRAPGRVNEYQLIYMDSTGGGDLSLDHVLVAEISSPDSLYSLEF